MVFLDLTNVEDSNNFELLPNGNYNLIADSAEESESKSGNRMLKMKFKVTDGEYRGRVLFENLVLSGNETAVKISMQKIKTLLKLNNKSVVLNDLYELVGLEVGSVVKTQISEQYGDKNVISYYKQKAKPQSEAPF